MGDFFVEEKALGVAEDQWLCSLNESSLMFYETSSDVHVNSIDGCNYSDDEFDCSKSHDSVIFWESHKSMLKELLAYNRLTGAKLREEVNKGLEMVRENAGFCVCCCNIVKPNNLECNGCLRQAIVNYLHDNGFNATLSTSQWKPRKKMLGGKHEYIDAVATSYKEGEAKQIKEEIRYVIELEFRGEFQIAKASEEYQQLLNLVPESYVGKPENMNAIIRVICNAAKRSMEEKNIHMGPWREHSFMMMKWSSSSSSSSSDLRLCNRSNAVEVS